METRLPTVDECRQLAERWPDDFRWPADRLAFDLGFDTYCFLPGDIPRLTVWHDNDERMVCSIESFCSIKSFLAALTAKMIEIGAITVGYHHTDWPAPILDDPLRAALLPTKEQSDE